MKFFKIGMMPYNYLENADFPDTPFQLLPLLFNIHQNTFFYNYLHYPLNDFQGLNKKYQKSESRT